MKPKTMVLMVVAVGCGLGASFMTSRLLAERGKEQTEETVPVLVARTRVASWQPIRDPERFFEIKQYPKSVAPAKALADFPEIKDQRLNKPVDEGKPVSQADLLTKEQYSMAENLQPGQRAIAIKVTAESLVGGFVLPGTRVDVVYTTRGADSSSRIILQNMLILAVDTQDQRADGQKSMLGQTVTLAATPEESTRLSLASAGGELRLLLKSGSDSKRTYNVESKPADLNRPLQGDSDKESDAPPATAAVLPAIPEDTKPLDAPVPVPVKVECKKKRHIMKIHNGLTTEKAFFHLEQKKDDDDDDTPSAPPPPKTEAVKKPDAPPPAPPTPPVAPPPVGGKVSTTRTSRTR